MIARAGWRWLVVVAMVVGNAIAMADAAPTTNVSARGGFAVDENCVRLFSPALRESFKIMVIGDAHLSLDDERGKPFATYSGRMAKCAPAAKGRANFEKSLALAKASHVDLIALVGDIFSFPSEAAIEWARARLTETGIPFIYISGNHDWHYEGMEGTDADLRAKWTEKRLKPLYQGKNPLMAAYDIKGVRFVAIDNSTYEILPEQLAFYREQVTSGRPLVLLMHIPLYAPGRGINFGCGHPDWGAKSDSHWDIERRQRWPTTGPTATTFAFHREVFATPNLLGVFCGHTHKQSLDCVNGIPQFVCPCGLAGKVMIVEVKGQ